MWISFDGFLSVLGNTWKQPSTKGRGRPKLLPDPPKRSQDFPRDPRKSSPERSRAARGTQEAPKSAPETPQTRPRGTRERPRGAHEHPRGAQERPRGAQDSTGQECPRGVQEVPQGDPEAPKSHLNPSQMEFWGIIFHVFFALWRFYCSKSCFEMIFCMFFIDLYRFRIGLGKVSGLFFVCFLCLY